MVSQCSAAVTTFLFNVTMMKLLGEDGVAAIAGILRGDGRMACCSACGVFYADADDCFVVVI